MTPTSKGTDDLERWSTAVHEASHVVVARMFRIRHGHVSIRSNGTGYVRILASRGRTFVSPSTIRREALKRVVMMHMPFVIEGVADLMPDGAFGAPRLSEMKVFTHTSDFNDAQRELAEAFGGFDTREQSVEAVKLIADIAVLMVLQAWPAIAEVARAVYERQNGRLSSREIRAIVDAAPISWFGDAHRHVRRRVYRRLNRAVTVLSNFPPRGKPE